MPRAITAFTTGPGFGEYKLGPREAFTPLAFTVFLSSSAVSPLYGVFVQWRDATNYPIHTQFVGVVSTHSFSLSMADGTEPFYHDGSANQDFPQLENYYLHSIVNLRMPLIPLIKGTSFGIYCTDEGVIPNNYPIGLLEPKVEVQAAHLWVEDDDNRGRGSPRTGPWALIPGRSRS